MLPIASKGLPPPLPLPLLPSAPLGVPRACSPTYSAPLCISARLSVVATNAPISRNTKAIFAACLRWAGRRAIMAAAAASSGGTIIGLSDATRVQGGGCPLAIISLASVSKHCTMRVKIRDKVVLVANRERNRAIYGGGSFRRLFFFLRAAVRMSRQKRWLQRRTDGFEHIITTAPASVCRFHTTVCCDMLGALVWLGVELRKTLEPREARCPTHARAAPSVARSAAPF